MKISKIVDSRKKWKEKAKGRGSTIRQLRKGAKNQKRQDSEKLSENDEIRRLTEENAELRALLDERKLPLEGDPVIQQKMFVRYHSHMWDCFLSVGAANYADFSALASDQSENSAFYFRDQLDAARRNCHLQQCINTQRTLACSH